MAAITAAIGLATAAAGAMAAKKNADAAKGYGKQAQFNPYNINTPYGNVNFQGNTANARLSPFQQQFQQYLQGQGQGFLGAAGNTLNSGGLTPGMTGAYDNYLGQVPGAQSYNPDFAGQAGMFGNASKGFMDQLGSFDPKALASQYTQNLRAGAQPENQRAVNSTVQGLFNGGRLGSTGGADILGRLGETQNQQDLGFQKAGMDYAGSEQNRLAGLGSQFGQQSGMFKQMGFDNAFQLNDMMNTRANQRFSNAMQMFGMGQGNMGIGLGAGQLGQGLLGQSQGIDQGLLQMIQSGGNLGAAKSGANQAAYAPQLQAQQNYYGTLGNLGGSFLGGMMNRIGGSPGGSYVPGQGPQGG